MGACAFAPFILSIFAFYFFAILPACRLLVVTLSELPSERLGCRTHEYYPIFTINIFHQRITKEFHIRNYFWYHDDSFPKYLSQTVYIYNSYLTVCFNHTSLKYPVKCIGSKLSSTVIAFKRLSNWIANKFFSSLTPTGIIE